MQSSQRQRMKYDFGDEPGKYKTFFDYNQDSITCLASSPLQVHVSVATYKISLSHVYLSDIIFILPPVLTTQHQNLLLLVRGFNTRTFLISWALRSLRLSKESMWFKGINEIDIYVSILQAPLSASHRNPGGSIFKYFGQEIEFC